MKATIHPSEIPRVRNWKGVPLSPVEEIFMFHKETGPVPETFRRLQGGLEREGIEYVVIGAVAMAAHRFRRATEDVDLCVRPADLARFREKLVGTVYQSVEGRSRRFYDPQTQVTFDLLLSGELAGHREKNKVIRFPDPSEAVEIEGLRTVSLERLIELKLVTWRFRDWGDVVELIRRNNLDEAFAERVDPLVRMAYVECYDQKVEEDKYEREA